MDIASTTQTDTSNTLRREIDRLKADLDRLRSDFSGLAQDAVHTAKTGAGQARERVEQRVRAAADQARDSVEAMEYQVAAHPLMSLTTAVGVGIVVGLALSRKA